MSKFKRGDKVRIGTAVHGAPDALNGTTGVIEHVDDADGDYRVRMDADGDYWWYRDAELSLVDGSSSDGLESSNDNATLRDQFAMAALTGLCADPSTGSNSREDFVNASYALADAMLAARNAKAR